jgi:histidine triad (HIT) family protein
VVSAAGESGDTAAGGPARAAGAPAVGPPARAVHDPACLFCRIVAGEIPSKRFAEDELAIAIRDIAPRSPTHILVLPRAHIPSAADLSDADAALVGRLFAMAAAIARAEGIADAGYRIVTNVGEWGGQSVGHLHFHLMGGRPFDWPPG